MANVSPAVLATDVEISVGGVSIAGASNSVAFDLKANKIDVSTFGPQGREYIVGPVDGTVKIDGYFDKSTGGADEALVVPLLAGTIAAVEFDVPNSDAGSIGYSFDAVVESYSVNPKFGAAIPFSGSLGASGPITRAVLT